MLLVKVRIIWISKCANKLYTDCVQNSVLTEVNSKILFDFNGRLIRPCFSFFFFLEVQSTITFWLCHYKAPYSPLGNDWGLWWISTLPSKQTWAFQEGSFTGCCFLLTAFFITINSSPWITVKISPSNFRHTSREIFTETLLKMPSFSWIQQRIPIISERRMNCMFLHF